MAENKKRNPLLALEDWWTVWFGMAILLVAIILGGLHHGGQIEKQWKMGKAQKWVSSPADLFWGAKKTKLKIEDEVTVAQFAEKLAAKAEKGKYKVELIEIAPEPVAEPVAEAAAEGEAAADAAEGAEATPAEVLPPVAPKVQLKIASARDEDGKTLKVKFTQGVDDLKIEWAKEGKDPNGLGAMAYVSQVFDSADVMLGTGNVEIAAQRSVYLLWPILIGLLGVGILTAFGVAVMGQSPSKYFIAYIAVCVLATLSYLGAKHAFASKWGLGYAAWALVIGLLISNTIGTPKWLQHGVRTEMYIKTGLVLLGAEILFGRILTLGVPGLMVAWIVTPTVIIFMWLFGTRILKMTSKPLVMIVAAATSVCGVSAAIAAAGATRAKKDELTLGVGMTLIFTVAMMVAMPPFIKLVGISDIVGAAWMGGTIDSTGAVVAAGAFLGPKAETVAAVVKMVQNVLIGVVGFFVALFWVTSVERDPDAPRPGLSEIWVRFPKFILGFIAASFIFSFLLVPLFASLFPDVMGGEGIKLVDKGVIKAISNPLRGWLFCFAFVSIGLESNFKELASQMEGGKPMVLYVVGQSFNLILTLFMAWLAFSVCFPNAI